jgi:hypothetical protein
MKENNKHVIDKAELRRMSQAERQELASLLAELDEPISIERAPAQATVPAKAAVPDRVDPFWYDPSLRRERRMALLIAAACCVILAGWIVVLAATLPHHFDAHHWRAVWVNFDVFLLAAFAATAWALWRERQVLILLLALIGTMLVCDAWFDVGTSLATSGFVISLLSALLAELPLAFLAFVGAWRLLKATVAAGIVVGQQVDAGQAAPAAAVIRTGEGSRAGTRVRVGVGHSLCRTPLAGCGLDEALPRGRAERQAEQAERVG